MTLRGTRNPRCGVECNRWPATGGLPPGADDVGRDPAGHLERPCAGERTRRQRCPGLADEWCGSHPNRFIPLAMAPYWDVEALVGEVQRVAAKGWRAMTFSSNPLDLDSPSLHNDHRDQFWAACQESEIVLCIQPGGPRPERSP